MNRTDVAVAVAALTITLLVAGGVTAALVFGVGPPGGGPTTGDGDEATATPASTGTVYTAAGDGEAAGDTATRSDATDDTTPTPAPFAFEVLRIEECGDTCRDVTAEVTNNQNEAATGVQVYTRIYAGNSSDSGDRVWEGTEDIGRLEAGESATSTRRVDLSYGEALEIQNEGGWITILTTVESDDVTITFKERRNVA